MNLHSAQPLIPQNIITIAREWNDHHGDGMPLRWFVSTNRLEYLGSLGTWNNFHQALWDGWLESAASRRTPSRPFHPDMITILP